MSESTTAKKERREYGAGGISYDAKRDRWCGTIEAGWTARGTRRRIKVYGKTEPAARTAIKNRLAKIAREGLPTEGASARTTVRTWALQWLAVTVRKLRPNSQIANAAAVNTWIIPTIGKKKLVNLTPGDLRAVENAIRAAGRSSSTAHRVHTTLIKMLKDARVEGHQVPDRILHMPAPSRAISDRDAIELDAAFAILTALADLPDGSRWVAALLQGMRQGECLGLTWDCVDLDGRTLDVSWQLQEIPFEHGCSGTCAVKRPGSCPSRRLRVPDGYQVRQLDGRMCLVRPKTEQGQRIIPLVPWMTAALAAWRDRAPVSPHGLVWPAADGRPRSDRDDRAAWCALQDAAQVAKVDGTIGRRYLLHEARHTTATLLLQARVDPETIKAILGHSEYATSRGYQHVNQEMARQAMEAVAERLGLPLLEASDQPAPQRVVSS